MATIAKDHPVFTAIVRLTCEAGDQQQLLDVASKVAPVMARQPGFVSLSVHRNLDGTEILNYLQWRSRADHEACLASPEMMAAGQELMGLISAGKARIEINLYEVVHSAEAPATG